MKLGKILLITGNPGKAQELCSASGLSLDHRGIDLVEIQSLSALEIGHHKALEALSKLSDADRSTYDAVLTDDTSLAFKALNGFPGSLIKYCLEALGTEGLVRLVEGQAKIATASCCLSLGLTATNEVVQFEGRLQGSLKQPAGTEGFGWDPIFFPIGSSQSFAQMSAEAKQQISHRALAVQKLVDWLEQP